MLLGNLATIGARAVLHRPSRHSRYIGSTHGKSERPSYRCLTAGEPMRKASKAA